MKIEVTDQEDLKKRIEFEIPQDVLSDELTKIYRQIGTTATVKGFRPGKVPRPILKRFYWSQIESQVINNLVPGYYRDALEETALDPITEPEFEDFSIEEGEPLLVSLTVEVKPFIEPRDYKGIEVEWKKVQATDEDVADMLTRLQENNAQFEVVEDRPIKEADVVVLDYEGTIEAEAPQESLDVRNENILIQINGAEQIDDFKKALIGIRKGETKKIESATIPEDFPEEKLRGKKGVFTVTIKEIKEKKLPPLDDEFARDLGDYDDLDELKRHIETQIQSNLEKQAENVAREKLISTLLEKNPYEPPDKMIELRLDEIIANIENQLRLSASDSEANKWDRTLIRKDLKPQAKRDVHVSLILESIARKEGLRASKDEVDESLRHLSAQARESFEDFKEKAQDNGTWDRIRTSLTVNKAMDFIMEKAVKKEMTEGAGEDSKNE